MSIKLANNAIGVVVSSIGSGATTIHLGAGQGQRFPSLNAGEWFPATITSDAGAMEIVSVTARSGDVLTVERGQEGTQPIEFPAGSIIELRLTAGSLLEITSMVLPAGLVAFTALSTPPQGWIICDGRVLTSATPYTALRQALIADGRPWGADGNNNPRIPNGRGRVPAGADLGAGVLSGGLFAAMMGQETHTLTVNEMPAHNHPASSGSAGSHSHDASTNSTGSHSHSGSAGSAGAHRHTYNSSVMATSGSGDRTAATTFGNPTIESSSAGAHTHSVSINSAGAHSHTVTVNSAGSHSHSVTVSNRGGGQAHNNVQPTIVFNMIIKT